MHVAITFLKAPWPAGAKVGEVVDVGDGPVPECFVGKCVPAQEGATAQHTYVRASGPVDPLADLRAENAALRAECASLRDLLSVPGVEGGGGPGTPVRKK
jgi:hypothetical protein